MKWRGNKFNTLLRRVFAGVFLINKCAKKRGNYTEKIVKCDIPKLRIFAKKVGISCEEQKSLIFTNDFDFNFFKNRRRE